MKRLLRSERARAVLQVAATVLLVGWILLNNDGRAVFSHLSGADPMWLGAAAGVLVASLVLGALQWELLLRAGETRIAFRRLFRAYSLGMFLNFVLPSGVGGDVVRAIQIRSEAGGARSAAATLLDRFAGLFTLAFLAFIASLLLPRDADLPGDLVLISGAGALLFCLFGAALFSRRLTGLLLALASLAGEGRLRRAAGSLREAFLGYRSEPGTAARVLGISVATQVLRISVHWFAARALGIEIAFAWFLLLVPVVSLVSLLPVSVGGWGLREGFQKTVFALPFVMPGVPSGTAHTLALSLAFLTSLLGMLVPAVVSLLEGVLFSMSGAPREASPSGRNP